MKEDQKEIYGTSSNDEEVEGIEEIAKSKIISRENSNITPLSSGIIEKKNIILSKKFYWEDEFSSSLSVSIVDTNFESSTVSLHYGNFRLLCNILFVNFPENIFSSSKLIGTGSFGSVYELEINGNISAVKINNIKDGIAKGFSMKIYKEYFLNCLAYQLGVGPEVLPVFGYDLLITEKAVIFSMEKCALFSSNQSETISNELFGSLEIMHSVGFVHLDIKPENIAFSEKLQKYVFIDFGLSRLVEERIGQKTMTNFLGTLRYCSEEMKKCYILREKMMVDLFENDRISMKKTSQELMKESKENNGDKKSFSLNEINSEEISDILVRKFCAILNLKHCLFSKDIQKTYNLFQKCTDLPKCCCEIFSNKNVCREIIEDDRINNLIKEMKEMALAYQYVKDVDGEIYFYINEEAYLNIISRSFPIGAINNMEDENFVSMFAENHWLSKIFFFICPFESERIKEVSNNIWSHRENIIKKIFKAFASRETKDKSEKFPHFISFKTEFVLHFFYERIKEMKNVRMLISLRLLFIATMAKFDSKFIQKIEQEILSLTEDKEELVLRIINFVLFWKLYNLEFDFEYKELSKWIETVLKENGSEKCNSFSKIGLLEALINNDYLKLAQFISVEGKHPNLKFVDESGNQKYSDLIINIAYHLIAQINNISALHKIVYLINYENSSEFVIYFSHQNNFKRENKSKQTGYLKFSELFYRFPGTIFWEFYVSNPNEDDGFFKNFDNFMIFYEVIGIDEQLFAQFSFTIREDANLILFVFEMVLKECYKVTDEFMKLLRNLCLVSTFLSQVECNLIETEVEIRLSHEQVKEMFERISELLRVYKEKFVPPGKSKLFYYKINSIEIQLALKDNEKKIVLRKEFVEEIESVLPVNLDDKLLERTLISIFDVFQGEILEVKGYCFEGFYFRDLFERFCDDLILQNGIYVIVSYENILLGILKLKFRKNKIDECFNYLVLICEATSKIEDFSGLRIPITLFPIFFAFCQELHNDFLYEKYLYLMNDKKYGENCLSLLFAIFVEIKERFENRERAEILKCFAMKMKTLSMKFYELIHMRYEIFNEALKASLYKNERQKGIFLKKWSIYLSIYSFSTSDLWTHFNKANIKRITISFIRNILFEKNTRYFQIYSMSK